MTEAIKQLTYILRKSIIRKRNFLLKVGDTMNVTIENASKNLAKMIEIANESEPVTIVNDSGNAVLIGEDEYRSLIESINLYTTPGFLKRLKESSEEKIEDCAKYNPDEPW